MPIIEVQTIKYKAKCDRCGTECRYGAETPAGAFVVAISNYGWTSQDPSARLDFETLKDIPIICEDCRRNKIQKK